MMAASYWSLLAPSLEMAEESGNYGDYAFLPAVIGFFLGSLFVYVTDVLITTYGLQSASIMLGKFKNPENTVFKCHSFNFSVISIIGGMSTADLPEKREVHVQYGF